MSTTVDSFAESWSASIHSVWGIFCQNTGFVLIEHTWVYLVVINTNHYSQAAGVLIVNLCTEALGNNSRYAIVHGRKYIDSLLYGPGSQYPTVCDWKYARLHLKITANKKRFFYFDLFLLFFKICVIKISVLQAV